ncbi:MAG: hypothetical protein Gaeavirus3_27 [Gaeavirus sp.]|uniref:Uncharacterized protein n=1 Tax=Gaeavirus sp. TaxID=2487767 RepID=A0A3G5A2A8_9VIRU|nr:MAG: hypothetical protein Gaeavirus3_27 [Gaeavirus sp.]
MTDNTVEETRVAMEAGLVLHEKYENSLNDEVINHQYELSKKLDNAKIIEKLLACYNDNIKTTKDIARNDSNID